MLVFPAGTGLGGMSGPIGLAMTGTHVRLGPHPNGNLGATIMVDFAPRMFLRLQVIDYRDWFPRNPNPRNRLTRYTEGNLITPLVDGATFFREMYRMMRATYKDIDPDLPPEEFDPYAPVGDAPADGVAQTKLPGSNKSVLDVLSSGGKNVIEQIQDAITAVRNALSDMQSLEVDVNFGIANPHNRQ